MVNKPIPDDSTVVGVPGRVVVHKGVPVKNSDLRHDELPDPVIEVLHCLLDRVGHLEKSLQKEESGFNVDQTIQHHDTSEGRISTSHKRECGDICLRTDDV